MANLKVVGSLSERTGHMRLKLFVISCWMIVASFSACMEAVAASDPASGWPESINSRYGFRDLGEAIRKNPEFPASGSDLDKARYVASLLPTVAQKYELGFYGLNRYAPALTGVNDFMNWISPDLRHDIELRGKVGMGDLGAWAFAFCEMLQAAGVGETLVAYGDNDPADGAGAGSPDTMVVIMERGPDGRTSRRAFDPFRASLGTPDQRPSDSSMGAWMDVPLDACDRWRDEHKPTWKESSGFKFVKSARSLSVLSEPDAAHSPSEVDRPTRSTAANSPDLKGNSNPAPNIIGTWIVGCCSGRFIWNMEINSQTGGAFSGTMTNSYGTDTVEGTVSGDKVSFTRSGSWGSQTWEGTVSADPTGVGSMTGTWSGFRDTDYSHDWNATRTAPPQ